MAKENSEKKNKQNIGELDKKTKLIMTVSLAVVFVIMVVLILVFAFYMADLLGKSKGQNDTGSAQIGDVLQDSQLLQDEIESMSIDEIKALIESKDKRILALQKEVETLTEELETAKKTLTVSMVTPMPVTIPATPKPTKAPTPVPTSVPTPVPTPEPVVTEVPVTEGPAAE